MNDLLKGNFMIIKGFFGLFVFLVVLFNSQHALSSGNSKSKLINFTKYTICYYRSVSDMHVAYKIKKGDSKDSVLSLLSMMHKEKKLDEKIDKFNALFEMKEKVDPYQVAATEYGRCIAESSLRVETTQFNNCFKQDFYLGFLEEYIGVDIDKNQFIKVFGERFSDITYEELALSYEVKEKTELKNGYNVLEKIRIEEFRSCVGYDY